MFLVLIFSALCHNFPSDQRQCLETHMSTHLTTCPTHSMGWVRIFSFVFLGEDVFTFDFWVRQFFSSKIDMFD